MGQLRACVGSPGASSATWTEKDTKHQGLCWPQPAHSLQFHLFLSLFALCRAGRWHSLCSTSQCAPWPLASALGTGEEAEPPGTPRAHRGPGMPFALRFSICKHELSGEANGHEFSLAPSPSAAARRLSPPQSRKGQEPHKQGERPRGLPLLLALER